MFADVSEDTITDLLDSKDSKSTKRVVQKSVSAFRKFLGEDADFEKFPKEKLNEKLRLFFASIRKGTGEYMKKSSLTNMRYGISKYLKEKCSIDIGSDIEFSSSKDVFKAVVVDLKKKGFASTEHKPPISRDDLMKMYTVDGIAINTTTPCGLQKKVLFDLMLYLCRRGQENLRTMTKTTFEIQTDSSGREYVFQSTDEIDKNHRDGAQPDDTVGEGRMYARTGDPLCPFSPFKLYLQKLHPQLNDLWQRPHDSYEPNDNVWYCKAPVGKNTLALMMPEISEKAKLSQRYTNHSVRATSITALDDSGIEARHIMRASGHKSEASIRSYSKRLSENKKRQMSDTLNNVLVPQAANTNVSQPVPSVALSNDQPSVLGLSAEELNLIFSRENSFDEIQNMNVTAENLPIETVPVTSNVFLATPVPTLPVQLPTNHVLTNVNTNVPATMNMMNKIEPWSHVDLVPPVSTLPVQPPNALTNVNANVPATKT